MIPNDKAFNGKKYFEYDGKIFYRWYEIKEIGQYEFTIKFISSHSLNAQGIVLFFSDDFSGEIKLNNKKLKILKGFKHYLFKEAEYLNEELKFSINSNKGYIFFGNASEETKQSFSIFHSGAFACAFWIEPLNNNHFRFHCNDHEYDDDFNDLVFDLIIENKK